MHTHIKVYLNKYIYMHKIFIHCITTYCIFPNGNPPMAIRLWQSAYGSTRK